MTSDAESTTAAIDLRPGEAVYLFAIAGTDDLGTGAPSVTGFSGEPAVCLSCGPWTAVVDRVDAQAWTGEEAESNFQSLEWIGPRAVRHEEVAESLMQVAPVYPAPFGTLFSSAGELVDRVSDRADVLRTFFDQVDGCREWAVHGHLDRSTAQEALAGPADDEGEPPGTAYLKQRRRKQAARSDVETWLDGVADRLAERVTDLPAQLEALDPSPRPEEAGEPVLQWAVLCPKSQETALAALLRSANEDYADRGLRFRLQGPWPPYRFRPEDDGPTPPTGN